VRIEFLQLARIRLDCYREKCRRHTVVRIAPCVSHVCMSTLGSNRTRAMALLILALPSITLYRSPHTRCDTAAATATAHVPFEPGINPLWLEADRPAPGDARVPDLATFEGGVDRVVGANRVDGQGPVGRQDRDDRWRISSVASRRFDLWFGDTPTQVGSVIVAPDPSS
jgi:hypothetical protein